MKKLWPVFLLALTLRLILAPIFHHSDADTIFYWGKYLWEKKDFLFFLGKAVPNAMPSAYPPIFYYLLFLWRGFYELIGNILWRLNLKIGLFPSNLIFWYQSYKIGVAFNKIPAILADLGCAYLIYKIAKKIGKKESLVKNVTILFLFLPASWYNSAYWGQIESIYSFFILLSFFLMLKDKFLWATFSLAISALIKPTGLFILPAFLIFAIKKKKIIDVFVAGLLGLVAAVISYFPFQPLNTLCWSINFYFKSFRGELNYLVANAFNFWALIFGFDQRPDSATFVGVPFRLWGFLLFSLLVIIISVRLGQKINTKQLILAAFLCAFAAFLFLPRMHERYFYTVLIFSAILGGLNKRWLYGFVLLSVVHFFNLYHFWWQPKIPFLITILSDLTLVRGIIVINLIIFGHWMINYLQNGAVNNNC